MSIAATRAGRSGGSRSRPGRGGLLIAVLSAATFGTSGTFGSALIASGWSPAAAVTARIAVSAVMLTLPALLQLRGQWRLLRRGAGRIAAYGLIAVVGCQLFYFNAIQHMAVGVALLLEFLGAVLVVGWLWLRHHQRPRRLTVAGAGLAVAGLAMVLDLTGSSGLSPIGVMWGLLSAVALAVFFVLSAAQDVQPIPPIVMTWAGMCIGAVTLVILGGLHAVPMTASTRDVDLLHHHVSWLVPLLGLSVLGTVVGYVAGIDAARRLGAKLASFVGMSEVLFAILFAWVLLRQLPSDMQFAGGAFIVAGVALVRLDELREAPAESTASALEGASALDGATEPVGVSQPRGAHQPRRPDLDLDPVQ